MKESKAIDEVLGVTFFCFPPPLQNSQPTLPPEATAAA